MSCQIIWDFFAPSPGLHLCSGDLTKNFLARVQVLLNVIWASAGLPPLGMRFSCLSVRLPETVSCGKGLSSAEQFLGGQAFFFRLYCSAGKCLTTSWRLGDGGLKVEKGKSQFVPFVNFRGVNTLTMAVCFKHLMIFLIEYI